MLKKKKYFKRHVPVVTNLLIFSTKAFLKQKPHKEQKYQQNKLNKR